MKTASLIAAALASLPLAGIAAPAAADPRVIVVDRGNDHRRDHWDRREWDRQDDRRDRARAYREGYRDGRRSDHGRWAYDRYGNRYDRWAGNGHYASDRWATSGRYVYDQYGQRVWVPAGSSYRGYVRPSAQTWNDGRHYAPNSYWWGPNGQVQCRRGDGTAGVIVGAVAGGTLGNVIAGQGDKRLGSVVGGTLGAILGNEIARGNARCR